MGNKRKIRNLDCLVCYKWLEIHCAIPDIVGHKMMWWDFNDSVFTILRSRDLTINHTCVFRLLNM